VIFKARQSNAFRLSGTILHVSRLDPKSACLEKVLDLRLTFWTGSPSKKVR
jgi:hypothetical protein